MAKRIYNKYDILEGLAEFEMMHDAMMHDQVVGDEDDTPPYGIPRPTELPDED